MVDPATIVCEGCGIKVEDFMLNDGNIKFKVRVFEDTFKRLCKPNDTVGSQLADCLTLNVRTLSFRSSH
jgi:hypothetical protein